MGHIPRSLSGVFLNHEVLHSSLNIFVPEAVDYGVEHGGQKSIEEGDEFVCKFLFVCPQGVLGFGLPIHEKNSPIEDNHHSEVGRAGREVTEGWGSTDSASKSFLSCCCCFFLIPLAHR